MRCAPFPQRIGCDNALTTYPLFSGTHKTPLYTIFTFQIWSPSLYFHICIFIVGLIYYNRSPFEMSSFPNPIRRSTRLHSRTALRVPPTNHQNSSSPSIQMTGPRTTNSQNHMAIWRPQKGRIVPNTRGLIKCPRVGPRYYRQPPPEAYLIVRAHRRPADGWDEDWSKKGDGW